MKCYGCGVERDLNKLEVYSHPEDDRLTDEPIPPLMVVECQPEPPLYGSFPNAQNREWKAVVVCHECFHRLDPDMWIGEVSCWERIKPVVIFDKLPKIESINKWEPGSYPDLA